MILLTSSRSVTHQLTHSHGTSFAALYLAAIATAGGVAGALVRFPRKGSFIAPLLLVAIAVAIGAVHVAGAPPGERWFRASKVVVFIVAIVAGFLQSGRGCVELA
jgi:hypothetical protein